MYTKKAPIGAFYCSIFKIILLVVLLELEHSLEVEDALARNEDYKSLQVFYLQLGHLQLDHLPCLHMLFFFFFNELDVLRGAVPTLLFAQV